MYITDTEKQPLQVVLRGILMRSVNAEEMNFEEVLPAQTLQMAAVVITAVPVVVIYPFIQKHFTKGVLLGSVKG
jgi:putative aldouronate transport system permease protein